VDRLRNVFYQSNFVPFYGFTSITKKKLKNCLLGQNYLMIFDHLSQVDDGITHSSESCVDTYTCYFCNFLKTHVSVSLMLFSKRSFQLVLNRLILVTSIGYEVFELVDVFEQFDSLKQLILIHYSLVLLSWIFLLLANRYIKKDEALIRSVDRLR